MNHPILNTNSDPLPSIVGTAAHDWMEKACREWNDSVGRIDWIPESTLEIAPGVAPGHSDAYYIPLKMVVDWKFPGTEPLRGYRKNGPSDLYRRQFHLYGLGFSKLGFPVNEVAGVFFPRGGNLSGAYYWSEPFDEQIALDTLKRFYDLQELALGLDLENNPERYELIEMKPGHHCTHCSWFTGSAKPGGCKGFSKD